MAYFLPWWWSVSKWALFCLSPSPSFPCVIILPWSLLPLCLRNVENWFFQCSTPGVDITAWSFGFYVPLAASCGCWVWAKDDRRVVEPLTQCNRNCLSAKCIWFTAGTQSVLLLLPPSLYGSTWVLLELSFSFLLSSSLFLSLFLFYLCCIGLGYKIDSASSFELMYF